MRKRLKTWSFTNPVLGLSEISSLKTAPDPVQVSENMYFSNIEEPRLALPEHLFDSI